MSYILAVLMGALAIGGMWNHSDWRYWMSAWAVCALFIFVGHVGSFVHRFGDKLIDSIIKEVKHDG